VVQRPRKGQEPLDIERALKHSSIAGQLMQGIKFVGCVLSGGVSWTLFELLVAEAARFAFNGALTGPS
jgi:hypothetical protein